MTTDLTQEINQEAEIDLSDAVQTSGEFTPLPDGVYLAVVTKAFYDRTNDGTGLLLKVTHQIFEEEYAGRLVFTNFSVESQDPDTARKGKGALKGLTTAIGLDTKIKPLDLLEKPHFIKLKTEPANGMNNKTGKPYPAKNKITMYYSKDAYPKVQAVEKASGNSGLEDLPDFMKP